MSDEAESEKEAEFEPSSAESLYDNVEPEKSEVAEQEPAKEPEKEEEAETDTKEEKTDDEAVSASEEPSVSDKLADIEKQLSGMTGAYNAEKTKRQELEKAERPDIFEDQEGFVKSLQADNAKEMNSFKFNVWTNDVNKRHEDGKEVLAQFDALLDKKPWLWNEVDNLSRATGENPLQLAYDIYKRETKEPEKDVDIEKIAKDAIDKYIAEQADADKKAKLDDVKNNLPTDLSNEPSRADRKDPEYSSPTADQMYNTKAS